MAHNSSAKAGTSLAIAAALANGKEHRCQGQVGESGQSSESPNTLIIFVTLDSSNVVLYML